MSCRQTRNQKRKRESIEDLSSKINDILENLDPGWNNKNNIIANLPFQKECPECQSTKVYAVCKGPFSTLRCDPNWHMWWPHSSTILTRKLFEATEDDLPEEHATCSPILYFGPENWKQLQIQRINGILSNVDNMITELTKLREQVAS